MAVRISGDNYEFAPNRLTLRTMRLDFGQPGEATISLSFYVAREPGPQAIGLDGIDRMSPDE